MTPVEQYDRLLNDINHFPLNERAEAMEQFAREHEDVIDMYPRGFLAGMVDERLKGGRYGEAAELLRVGKAEWRESMGRWVRVAYGEPDKKE